MTGMNWTKPIVAGVVLAIALPAQAGGFGFSFSFSKGRRVILPPPAVVPAPVVVERSVMVPVPPPPVWVPPVYRPVVERVWVPTITTAYREVPVVDVLGRVISYRREPYVVRSGYWSTVTRQELVQEGYWATPGGHRRYPAGRGVAPVPTMPPAEGYGQPAPENYEPGGPEGEYEDVTGPAHPLNPGPAVAQRATYATPRPIGP
jgi:hypothetical protein